MSNGLHRNRLGALAGLVLCTACANTSYETGLNLCDRLSQYAKTVPAGEIRSVTLSRGGNWMVDHYKGCVYAEKDHAGEEFCGWLMENTSTEFMEANISRAISCLQGQIIQGYTGNTGIEMWKGEMSFYSPKLDARDVEIRLEYSVQYFDDNQEEDFLRIIVIADSSEET